MAERRGERQQNGGNPLVSGRGVTSVKNTVVQRIAGLAAQEVEGVHMGGGAARTASRASGGRTGSQDQTRGVSVDVGRTEVAIDLTMAVDYGSDILRTVNRVRDRISARVEPLTGLRITELNVTVTDVVFPETGDAEDDDTQSLPEPATQRQEPTTQRQETTQRQQQTTQRQQSTSETTRQSTSRTTRESPSREGSTREGSSRESSRRESSRQESSSRESTRRDQQPADDKEKDQTTELNLDKGDIEDSERRES